MDKRKVIDAYRRGFLTLEECAQLLGVERAQLPGLLAMSSEPLRIPFDPASKRPASS